MIAVMGGGLDRIYPSETQHLAAEIVSRGGTLISSCRSRLRRVPAA